MEQKNTVDPHVEGLQGEMHFNMNIIWLKGVFQ